VIGGDMMSVKKILNKSEITDVDYINFILETAASSARFGVIKEKEGPKKYFITRGNIHAMLIMPFGSGKTSSFLDIENAVYAYDITFPGLIGTITRDGEVVESGLMKAGGRVLIIDEFQLLDEATKNAMNSLLEYPHTYSRNLGYRVKAPVRKRSKYYSIEAKGNELRVYAKFSCIAGGMYISKKSTISRAWLSRFIPIRFTPTLDYYEKLSRGEKTIKINPRLTETDFYFPGYLDFHKLYWDTFKSLLIREYFEKHPDESGYTVRCLQDIVRLSCFIASLDNRETVKKEDYEQALRFLPNILLSYLYSGLDEIDLFILSNIHTMKQTEIAERLKVTPATVSVRIAVLKKMGVIL
jgi:hypothetical protein